MEIVANILHLRLDSMPEASTWSGDVPGLVSIAMIIEKYDLSASTSPFVHPWLDQFRYNNEEDIAAIAYCVNSSDTFEYATRQLINKTPQDILSLSNRPAYAVLPDRMFSKHGQRAYLCDHF